MEGKKNNSSKIIIGLLAVLCVVLAVMLSQSKGEATDLSSEKERLLFDLKEKRDQYSNLESINDSLDAVIVAEEAYYTALIDSISNLSDLDAAKIKKLENRVWGLKQKNKKLIAEINDLNAKYEALAEEKAMVDASLAMETAKNVELNAQNRMLEKEVAIGSMLQAPIVEASAFKVKNEKEKPTVRSRKTNRIKTCATISKNSLAAAGKRMVYVRITTPDNKVLNGTEGEAAFEFNGQPLLYSSKMEVDYQNEAMVVCIDYDRDEWVKGEYNVELYTEGYELGKTTITLK